MNRSDFQKLASLRLADAKALLDAGCYSGAYYLAGYAVECALKSCIAKETKEFDFPDKKRVNESYSHDLQNLLRTAKLEDHCKTQIGSNDKFARYWANIVNWDETKRYELQTTEEDARDLFKAIADPTDGVLQWLKDSW